jgi:Small integral membrane protein
MLSLLSEYWGVCLADGCTNPIRLAPEAPLMGLFEQECSRNLELHGQRKRNGTETAFSIMEHVLVEMNFYVHLRGRHIMLSWAITFLIVALVAALFGFTGLAAGAASIAKILFAVFLVLFLVSLIVGLSRRPMV